MRCRSHPCEPAVGVCASCLRERLLALIAAQNELAAAADHRRRSDLPPPLDFPRSVSPYVARRRSDGSDANVSYRHYHHRFFSTPQVGPAFDAGGDGGCNGSGYIGGGGGKRDGHRRFSLFATIFGHARSDEGVPRVGAGATRASRSGSWLSALIRGRWKKKPRPFLPCREEEAGMSPARGDESDDSACSIDYVTEAASGGWRRPTPTPMRRAAAAAVPQARGVSGFAVCLSPLVRASPAGRRCGAADLSLPREMRAMPSPLHYRHVSGVGPILGPNRSRKLADIGRLK